MPLEHLNPPGLSSPTGYTHVVAATGGRNIYISGQVALNERGEVVGEGDLEAQLRQVYENLKTALAAAGATFADVVKQTTYVVNFDAARDRPVIGRVRSQYLSAANPPASTLVGVQALANPALLVEVEAVAVLE
ncbi:MAG TPA: RidA family protein [Dehalococcoidia bacterium]|nr:RidA family protein [Dehalococcoidia bacterium]